MEEMNFDEMRSQIAILKAKLDKQDIVNDRMMHEVVNTKAESMKRPILVSMLCAVFVICIAPLSFHEIIGASWAFIIFTDLTMIYCLVSEFMFKRRLSENAMMNASLLDVAKKMGKFKKDYKTYTLSNMFIIMPIWVGWLIIENFMAHEGEQAIALCTGLVVGLVIGAIIGLRMYFHIQDTASDIIRQIEE